jgi:hypothetical protein
MLSRIPGSASAREGDTLNPFGFTFGINMGFYFPDYKPAHFYDGSPENENSLDEVLNNYYYRQQIEQELGYKLDTVNPYELPGKMPYKAAFSIGFAFKMGKSKVKGFFAQFNYVKLKAEDIVIMHLDVPSTSFENQYIECPIVGVENRYIMDLGYFRIYPQKKGNIDFYSEYGLNFTNVRVVSNEIQIGPTVYNLINEWGNQGYIPGSTTQTYQVIQGGVGLGLFATGGVRFKFNEVISVDPGFTLYLHHINLGTWDALRPSYNFNVRLILPF